MKAIIRNLVVLLTTVCVLSSCAMPGTEQSTEYPESSGVPSGSGDITAGNTLLESATEECPWYGQWKVEGFIQFQSAQLHGEAAEGYVGTKCWYENNLFASENDMYDNPFYSAGIIDRDSLDHDIIFQSLEQDLQAHQLVYEDYEPVF